MYSLRKHRAIIYASLNTSCIVSLLSPIDGQKFLGADHRRPVLLCRKIITIHCIYTEGSLYWCKSDIAFRYAHRRSNLMFTLNRLRSKNKIRFRLFKGKREAPKRTRMLISCLFLVPTERRRGRRRQSSCAAPMISWWTRWNVRCTTRCVW